MKLKTASPSAYRELKRIRKELVMQGVFMPPKRKPRKKRR